MVILTQTGRSGTSLRWFCSLQDNFQEVDEEFMFAKSADPATMEEVQVLLEDSVKGSSLSCNIWSRWWPWQSGSLECLRMRGWGLCAGCDLWVSSLVPKTFWKLSKSGWEVWQFNGLTSWKEDFLGTWSFRFFWLGMCRLNYNHITAWVAWRPLLITAKKRAPGNQEGPRITYLTKSIENELTWDLLQIYQWCRSKSVKSIFYLQQK